MTRDLAWASGERLELVAIVRRWLRDLHEDRESVRARIEKLNAYRGPNEAEARQLATMSVKLDVSRWAFDACLEVYTDALNPALSDAESGRGMRKAQCLLEAQYGAESSMLAVRVHRWLRDHLPPGAAHCSPSSTART